MIVLQPKRSSLNEVYDIKERKHLACTAGLESTVYYCRVRGTAGRVDTPPDTPKFHLSHGNAVPQSGLTLIFDHKKHIVVMHRRWVEALQGWRQSINTCCEYAGTAEVGEYWGGRHGGTAYRPIRVRIRVSATINHLHPHSPKPLLLECLHPCNT